MIPVWAMWTLGSLGGYALYEKFVKKEAHPFTSTTTLPGRVRAKALEVIHKSENPIQLKALGTALAANGDTKGAAAANNKAQAIEQQQAPFVRTISEAGATGAPTTINFPGLVVPPGQVALPPIQVSPGVFVQPPAATAPRKYTVASGDNLSSIAKRFGVTLSAMSSANPTKAKRKGWPNSIFVAEILNLPASAADSGRASHASGVAG